MDRIIYVILKTKLAQHSHPCLVAYVTCLTISSNFAILNPLHVLSQHSYSGVIAHVVSAMINSAQLFYPNNKHLLSV
jgi:uncharacterized PurR-regulated membrane protein YhhQ (DUF165 family)